MKTWVRPTPGAPGCLPAFRAAFTAARGAAVSTAADWPVVAVASAGSAATAEHASASSGSTTVSPRSHGARLLGGRELLVGPWFNRSRASLRSANSRNDSPRNASGSKDRT